MARKYEAQRYEFIFGEQNVYWVNDEGYNLLFLHTVEKHLNDLAYAVGYIYLEKIYSSLGIKWDPKDKNEVWEWSEYFKIILSVYPQIDNSIKVDLAIWH